MTIKESEIDHRVDVENLLIVFHNVRLEPGLGFTGPGSEYGKRINTGQ